MEKKSLSPKLVGTKVVLKKHDENLASTMFYYVEKDRERLGQFLPWVSFVKTPNDELSYIKHTHKCWEDGTLFDYGIFRKEDDVYMGNIGIHSIRWEFDRCEVGYWILGDFEGLGYISDALRTLEFHLFDLGFHRIEVRCSSINQRSASVPIACGYFYDGVLKENSIEQKKFRDTYIFSKLIQNYKKNHIFELTSMDEKHVLNIAKNLPKHFTKKGIEYIASDLKSQKGFIFRIQDKPAGFIMYYSNQGIAEIGWMGVMPEFQRSGVGKKLLTHLCDKLRDSQCSSLVVKTLDESVEYQPYENTRAFYLKNGFKKSHVIQHPENPECGAELVLKMDL